MARKARSYSGGSVRSTRRRSRPRPTRGVRTARSRRSRGFSTREYGLPVAKTWARANYAYPRGAGADRGKRPSYPIVPMRRARAARSYAARRGTAGTLATVDRAIRKRYGSVAAIYPGRRGGGRKR